VRGGVPGFQPAVAVAIVQQIVEFLDDEDRHDEPDLPCGEPSVRLAPGHLGERAAFHHAFRQDE
jgi:hypothetical protein